MSNIFILDACSLIASLSNEEGADVVRSIVERAAKREVSIIINKLNLLEVYYDVFREYGKDAANDMVNEIKRTPIQIKSEISDAVFEEAGRLKASYKISIADSVVLGETIISGGQLLTSDHHEFDAIEKAENIQICWIR